MASSNAESVAQVEQAAAAGNGTAAEGTEKGTPASHTCRLCSRVLPSNSPGRLKGKAFSCRHCLTMQTLLYRNLGPLENNSWSVEAKDTFFRKAAALETGHYTWPTVRTLVIEAQVTRHVKEQKNKVRSKSLPLDVWVKKGYNADHVRKFPAEEDPVMGQLYSVPVKEVSLADIRSLVTEEVQRKEREAQESRKKKRGTAGAEGADDAEDWDVVTQASQDDVAPVSKRPKTCTAGTSKAAQAKADKQFQRECTKAMKANETLLQLASKGTGILAKNIKVSQAVLTQAEKAGVPEDDFIRALQIALQKGETWNKACIDVLPLATAAKGTGARLSQMPFNGKELQEYAKNLGTLHKEIRSQTKAVKDQAAAEKKAASETAEK